MRRNTGGFSFLEAMIAVFIMGIFFVSAALVFSGISKGIFVTRTRTVATNLCQEKIQSLKNISYPRLYVTSEEDYYSVGYDTHVYRSESAIMAGDTAFETRVLVRRVKENAGGQMEEVSADGGDTGLKKITVTAVWKEGGENKSYSFSNLRDDPHRRPLDGIISGQVKNHVSPHTPIKDVTVSVIDNINWSALTDNGGNYTLKIPTGTYRIKAEHIGYWPDQSAAFPVVKGVNSHNIDLRKKLTGTVTGYVFVNTDLVISKVVASTHTALGEDLEWIEIFNPSRETEQIDASTFEMWYIDQNNNQSNFSLVFATTSVSPRSYYLIASSGTINLNGQVIFADAKYGPAQNTDTIQNNKGGVKFEHLHWHGGGGYRSQDRVAWGTGGVPLTNAREEVAVPSAIDAGKVLVRRTRVGIVRPDEGNALDTDNNSLDFESNQEIDIYLPLNSAISRPVVSGRTPLYLFASISCNDGVSPTVLPPPINSPCGPDFARFEIPEVATGTWTVRIFYAHPSHPEDVFQEEINNVVVEDGQIVGIPNAGTNPPWLFDGYTVTVVSSTPTMGMVWGWGDDLNGPYLPTGIKVQTGTYFTRTIYIMGLYFLPLNSGIYNLTVNPDNEVPRYTSQIYPNVTVTAGAIVQKDIALYKGGSISGSVVSSSNDNLTKVMVLAYDFNGNEMGSALSCPDGTFKITDLYSAGNSYTVKPVLDSAEVPLPASKSVNVVVGETVDAGTFIITGAYGNFVGQVSEAGKTIKTGALLVATTVAINEPTPPVMDFALTSGQKIYYTAVSDSQGNYILPVRGGANYNVYGWYTKMTGGVPFTVKKSAASSVNAGSNQTINFSW